MDTNLHEFWQVAIALAGGNAECFRPDGKHKQSAYAFVKIRVKIRGLKILSNECTNALQG